MERRTVILAVVLFIVIVAGMFTYAYLKRSEINEQTVVEQPTETEEPERELQRIDAKHFFIDGTHTLVGEIAMPTPCDLLDHDVVIAESFPEQVTVNFTVINNADACAQVITPQRFQVQFEASENATINATLRGEPVELNLIPPAEGETPEDFELFIKG